MNQPAPAQKKNYARPDLQPLGDIATLTLGSPGSLTIDMCLTSMDQGGPNDMNC